MRTLAVLLALALAGPAAAGQLAPRRASDVVTLDTSGAACALAAFTRSVDQRILPDGTVEPFALGPKEVLVITGIDWVVEGVPSSGQIQLLLYVDGAPVKPITSHHGNPVDGQVLSSTTIPPVVVKGSLCAASNTVVDSVRAIVHGFLAKDK